MKLGRNDDCWCGSGKKYKKCHLEFDNRIEQAQIEGMLVPDRTLLKTPDQVKKIRRSAEINTGVLDYVAERIQPGMTTGQIDKLVYEYTVGQGAVPAPLGYQGFPKSVCTSVNNEVCHGIPDEAVVLKEGDIVNVDVSTILDGYFSDASRMFCIGAVDEEAGRLVRVAKECVQRGIEAIRPWGSMNEMAEAVNAHAQANGYSVVEEIGGHGIGLAFHEDPYVCYVPCEENDMLLVPGMMFTVEPMVNQGGREVWQDEENGWTIRTVDGKLSAQWETMLVVTEDGVEILTE